MPLRYRLLAYSAGTLLPLWIAIALGHEGKRAVQLALLSLPVWLCLCWPARGPWWRGLQATAAGLWALGFVLDGAVRSFISGHYQASPSSAMVLTAIANSSGPEAREFLSMYQTDMATRGLLALALLGAVLTSLWAWWRQPPTAWRMQGWRIPLVLVVAAVALTSLSIKPWRKHHPWVFWPAWAAQVQATRAQWQDLDGQRAELMARARQQNPQLTPASPDTLVLVLSDSVNRRHMSMYGYPRETTPELSARLHQQPLQLRAFGHAWSVDASTIPALRNLFQFGHSGPQSQHLLALAASAGYQTWWISNHDDLAIDQQHARLATHVHMVNKTPGRSSASMDHDTLPLLQQALQHPAPRKLIVVHLLGAHPHYALRYPAEEDHFVHSRDTVYQHMKAQGRSARVKALRNDYDTAVTYHDKVVASTLDLCLQAPGRTRWMYLSDHGQEVGSQGNHAGHSATTADGYRIPLLVWSPSLEPLPASTMARPVRSDWLAHSIVRLLGIHWPGHEPAKDVLDPNYQWQAPQLPIPIDFLS